MSTKINIAALATLLAVLAAPGVVSAQEGFGNYLSARGFRDASAVPGSRSQPQINRFVTKVPSDAYGSVGGAHSKPISDANIRFEMNRDDFDRRPQ
jgi:hypothetical protein